MGNQQSKKVELVEKKLTRSKLAGDDLLTPITPLFHTDASYDFFTHSGEEICKEENYGIIPVECIHEILLFLKPSELVSAFQICKLIYEISKTNLWWKTYFENYFKDDEDFKEDLPENPQELNISWKKMFFKRYYFLTDCYYRTKYTKIHKPPTTNEERKKFSDPDPNSDICIVLIGEKSDHFLRNLKKEYHFFEREGNPIDNLYLRKVKNHSRYFSIGVRRYSGTNNEPFAERKRYIYGCFLCFDVYDEKDFQNTIKLYEMMKQEGHLDRFSVGLLCGMVLIDEGIEGMEKEREIEYEVGCEKAQNMELLGYIECDALKEGENFVLCFGIVMDGTKKRKKKKRIMSIKRRARKAKMRMRSMRMK